MNLEEIEILSDLEEKEAEKPVRALLEQDRQSLLRARSKTYTVRRNGTEYVVLEPSRGYDSVHHISADEMKKIGEKKFEERENALDYIQDYSNSSS